MVPYSYVLYQALNNFYGQLRGYRRGSIRRAVRALAETTPAAVLVERDRLFQARVRDALERFPAYARKVHENVGAIPAEGETVQPADLPIWTRDDQNRLFASLSGPPVHGAFAHATGGSTGEPTRFYMTRESYEWRTAASDFGYALAGAEEGVRSFYVWGTPIHKPSLFQRLKTGLHHRLQRRTYFDSFRFDDEQKRRCCLAIDRVKPYALAGYTGNLVELARFVRDNPRALQWKAATAVTAAEGLHHGQRELLEEQLADEVYQSYGSREFMLIGMECSEHSGYHIIGTHLLVEVVDDRGRPLPPGETGRILVSDLRNAANPFIRYEIGDLGAMAPSDERCPCGLPFPLLARVDGRSQEVIVMKNGQRMTALFMPHLMKEFPWVDGYQVAQTEPGAIEVRLVTREEPTAAQTQPITIALQGKLGGDMRICCLRVTALEKSISGKTPIVTQTSNTEHRS